MINVRQITELQQEAVRRWHLNEKIQGDNPFLELVLEQHLRNYKLWHEEDIARSPDVSDAEIARVKRSIDQLNQSRNDHIEQLDSAIIGLLENYVKVVPEEGAKLNTETPGSAIDRLSIMALRLYHMQEQIDRTDATEEHKESARQKKERCIMQHADLSQSLEELIDDLNSGKKRLKVYHQFKMYNDPSMNPYLYNRATKKEA